jgi:hypothetical protein
VVNAKGLGTCQVLVRSLVLLGLLASLLLATGAVPQNWEAFTRNALIAYGGAEFVNKPEWDDATMKTVLKPSGARADTLGGQEKMRMETDTPARLRACGAQPQTLVGLWSSLLRARVR